MSDLESTDNTSSACSLEDKLPSTNNLIRGKDAQYAVGRKIAQGRYGAVYEVLRKSDGKTFACKLEICERHSHGLDMDYTVMHKGAKKGCAHLVRMIDRGKIEDHFKFIIMPLLGDNLMKLQNMFEDGRFSLSTGLRLGLLTLTCIQELHSIGYTHRDIKPFNFCLDPNTPSSDLKIILIDYGVCRSHKDRNGELKTPRENVKFRGTTRYASLAAHKGEEQSPKDDLESWYYMVIEWISGYLPWSDIHREGHDDVRIMKEHVKTNDSATAMLFRFCPKVEFRRLQKYLDGLTYYNQVDHTYIAELIQLAIKNNGIRMDEPWDWEE